MLSRFANPGTSGLRTAEAKLSAALATLLSLAATLPGGQAVLEAWRALGQELSGRELSWGRCSIRTSRVGALPPSTMIHLEEGPTVRHAGAEVPMAEMLSYAPDLRSITGGQREFSMEFLRYEEVPPHLAGKHAPRGRLSRHSRCDTVGTREHEVDTNDRCAHELRRMRPHAAARRAGGDLPQRWRAPVGVRAVHGPGAARGVDPRGDDARG